MREKPRIIQLPKFLDKRGNLSFVEQMNQIPFVIRRVYWIYDVPEEKNVEGMPIFTMKSLL